MTIFVAPALVGYMADKLGSYTRVMALTLLGSGIFHTALLFLPSVYEVTTYPEMSSLKNMDKIESKITASNYTNGNRMVTNTLYFIFR